jgi:murein DD-endopeptidase MepM/ murein hydrolase activator NlpD
VLALRGRRITFPIGCRHQEPTARGGNYVWIITRRQIFSYYAHLQTITAQPGERVTGGQPIATLGRTGTNAYPERSPTHLHLMLLWAKDMTPVNPYSWLKKTS